MVKRDEILPIFVNLSLSMFLFEEIYWRQKSRELWLKEEDKNTKFFHRMASAHCRRNFMGRVRVARSWLSGEDEIKAGVTNAFSYPFIKNKTQH